MLGGPVRDSARRLPGQRARATVYSMHLSGTDARGRRGVPNEYQAQQGQDQGSPGHEHDHAEPGLSGVLFWASPMVFHFAALPWPGHTGTGTLMTRPPSLQRCLGTGGSLLRAGSRRYVG
jgi:hypothetical protein